MAERDESDGHRRPRARPPLPEHQLEPADAGMTHAQFVEALRTIDGLVDVTGGKGDRPNFHFRHRPFLHFHRADGGDMYADVKFGGGPAADFEPVWTSTPAEREDLLRRIRKHVRRAARR